MTVTVPDPTDRALEPLAELLTPVRDALLADAGIEADRIVSQATRAANDIVAAAQTEVAAAVERARHRAELSARANRDQVLARLRNENHRVVLETQQRLRHQLLESVRRSARNLRSDPRYPRLLNTLESMARSQLGDQAVIERDPEPDGGLVATAEARRVDYRLTALAERALDAIADEVAELWT